MKKSSQSNYRYLLNANLSRKLIPKLVQLTNQVFTHISDISDDILSDAEIIQIAKKEKLIIVTHDLDYGEIYYLKEKGNIGVIMLRLSDETSTNVLNRLNDFFRNPRYKKANLAVSLVIIADKKIRIYSP